MSVTVSGYKKLIIAVTTVVALTLIALFTDANAYVIATMVVAAGSGAGLTEAVLDSKRTAAKASDPQPPPVAAPAAPAIGAPALARASKPKR